MNPPPTPRPPRALVFDVFGTVVDWRASIIREGQMLSAAKGLQVELVTLDDGGDKERCKANATRLVESGEVKHEHAVSLLRHLRQ